MNKLIIYFLILGFNISKAQELNCLLTVDFQKIGSTDQKIFKTLETSLNEFINKTAWSTTPYKPQEKISCSITLILDTYDNDDFTGSIQIQSSRTAFNSTYASPIFNFNDKNFNFKYHEFENLRFNPANFDSNLISVIAFYCNIIIGLDQDTFVQQGGNESFENAANISNLAQTSGYKGWSSTEKDLNRYLLINDLTSSIFSPFRDAMYEYHLIGIDLMQKDTKLAKNKIIIAINNLKIIHAIRPNSFLSRIFFDAKSDEILAIFTGGPRISVDDLLETLNKVSPTNSSKWTAIN